MNLSRYDFFCFYIIIYYIHLSNLTNNHCKTNITHEGSNLSIYKATTPPQHATNMMTSNLYSMNTSIATILPTRSSGDTPPVGVSPRI